MDVFTASFDRTLRRRNLTSKGYKKALYALIRIRQFVSLPSSRSAWERGNREKQKIPVHRAPVWLFNHIDDIFSP